jgi:hypothetical protein
MSAALELSLNKSILTTTSPRKRRGANSGKLNCTGFFLMPSQFDKKTIPRLVGTMARFIIQYATRPAAVGSFKK